MKKKNKNILIIGIVLASIILIVLFANNYFFTVVSIPNGISCGAIGTSLACTVTQSGMTISYHGAEQYPTMSFPIDDDVARKYKDAIIEAWKKDDAVAREFFSTGINCGGGASYAFFKNLPETPEYNYIASYREQSEITSDDACGENYYQYYFDTPLSHFNNQLIVVDVSSFNERGVFQNTVKTYGTCNLQNKLCTIKTPLEAPDEGSINLGGFTIYLKYDGIVNDYSICMEDNIERCSGNNLEKCDISSHSFIDKGQVEGKCGYNAPVYDPNVPVYDPQNPTNLPTDTGTQSGTNTGESTIAPNPTTFFTTQNILIVGAILFIIAVVLIIFSRKRRR